MTRLAPDLVLQAGSVVNAQVLQVLADNLVRIAIASLSIDVLSEVPLQAGQTLQLAVSQNGGRHPARGGRAGRRGGRPIRSTLMPLSPDALVDSPPQSPSAQRGNATC